MSDGIRCMVMRGGTSKGLYFLRSDLPSDVAARDELLMRIMGTPDRRQIDGLGGAHPLTSKVAVVDRCSHGTAEVDYLFLQLGVDEALVADRQNCGNLLSGVAPFAIERELIAAAGGEASVRIHMLNSDAHATATFAVRDGLPVYEGETAISGVPGSAAPIQLAFDGTAGGFSGALLPTGNALDVVHGVAVTMVDNGMPVVVIRASDVGISGYETCAELEADGALRSRLEEIRLAAGPLMNLGDVADTTIPKMTMIASPKNGGAMATRTFIPHRCHQAIGVLGAVSVATGGLIPGSVAESIIEHDPASPVVTLEHPTGTFDAIVTLAMAEGGPSVEQAGIVRTARKLMDGFAFPRAS